MKNLTSKDAAGIEINVWDKVFYSDSKNIELKVGLVFAILKDNDVLIENQEKDNYLTRDGKTVGVAFKEPQPLTKQLSSNEEYLTIRSKNAQNELKLNKENLEKWLIKNYPVKGMTIQDIADEAGVAKTRVNYLIYNKHHLNIKNETKEKTKSKPKKLTQEQMDWLDSNYTTSLLKDKEILKMSLFEDCSEKAFQNYLRK